MLIWGTKLDARTEEMVILSCVNEAISTVSDALPPKTVLDIVNVSPIVYAVPSAVIVISEIFPSLPTTTVA